MKTTAKTFKLIFVCSILLLSLLTVGCGRTTTPTPTPEPNVEQQEPNTPPEPDVEQREPNTLPEPNEGQPEPQAQAPSPDAFFPLTKGSTWKYQGEGNEYASFNREVLFTQGDRAQIREDSGGTIIATVFKKTEDAVVITFSQGEVYDETNFLDQQSNQDLIVLKGPLKVGNKWEHPEGTKEIIDMNATVDTPAGRFENCVEVETTFPDSIVLEYFKEGVGMVKREFIAEDTRITSTLESYNIK